MKNTPPLLLPICLALLAALFSCAKDTGGAASASAAGTFANATVDAYASALVAYFKFEETASPFTSAVGSLTLAGTAFPALATGINGHGANFVAASSTYVANTGAAAVAVLATAGKNSFALSFWTKLSTAYTSGQRYFFVRNDSAANEAISVYEAAGPALVAKLRDGSGTNKFHSVTTTLAAGTWYHVLFAGDGTTTYLYLNGVAVGTGQTYSALSAGAKAFSVGTAGAGLLLEDGIIDEVAYWTDPAFSSSTAVAAFAAALYNSGNGLFLQ